MESIFEKCQNINDLILLGQEKNARDELIRLLNHLEENKIEYTPLINYLIRETGLYPYLQPQTASWQERFIYEAFKADIGDLKPITLHRGQSSLLKKLLEGKSIAVTAPTSFGKSFIIDAFISIKKPKNVVIIVPTIALTDEARRRIYKRFSNEYRIITTPDVGIELAKNNIFIFPQERAISYIGKIDSIDILIVDEFYKAGTSFDKDRAPILLKSILELGSIAKQKYFLAPNLSLSSLEDNPFTKGMEFVELDFNTVVSEISEDFKSSSSSDENFKKDRLLEILYSKKTKTLIYAGTFTNIDTITNILNDNFDDNDNKLLNYFSDWLCINYGNNYILNKLVKKGVGIHNGKLHRSLSQIQVKLFEEKKGLDNLISTSSIIEGVNTSAENVIIWASKNGRPKLNDFTYKNIIGRGGRMFRHFIGKIYLLEAPPEEKATELKLEFTEDLLNSLDTEKFDQELTRDQIIKIVAFNDEMDSILGKGVYRNLIKENSLPSFSPNTLRDIARDMTSRPRVWSGMKYLNSNNPNDWKSNLFLVLNYVGNVGISYTNMVAYIKAISQNWHLSIPKILSFLHKNEITIDKYFELERISTFKIPSVLQDINFLQKKIFNNNVDISPFIAKISHAFLPRLVYELEEYGLPRMLSKKIQTSGLIDLENEETQIHHIINEFNRIGFPKMVNSIKNIHPFEEFSLRYFYDGITSIHKI
ncbi:DEAD/DEAH box helicase [Akkermansia glycaniphila]|uniref:p-loop containing nucleoside triphosphate hydrolase n=1 Tax=Akkermansia glycaniphila TaxID=1679444 RepID=A0A1C7P9W4_9BACT|nr:DEAD/DEAH box helicase [Akkermansia glycaniphila]OCA02154.1 hypothetical protein AC781_11355 [Akkermansia glycaniphila]SEH99754.1 p-loop containing nucleoside triphosphate hydrolase [Akkermansia glycaniphila]